ncbi:MAG: hypothetical protein IT168_18610 [Bryobacterales bacterium]|nr:hypothetical protein [Bryobacterales bacterium]
MQIDRRHLLASLASPLLGSKQMAPSATRLFLDSHVVDRVQRASLRVGVVTKDSRNPLFVEDRPWEARYDNVYANVIRDRSDDLYKCWYSPFIVDPSVRDTPRSERSRIPYKPGRQREMGVCYATSKDGLSWEKPALGLIDFDGSTQNNLVIRGPHGAGVFRDEHDADPARRYKMLLQGRRTSGSFSPDGLHWTSPVEFPSIAAIGDTHNNALYSKRLGRYVGITRLWDRSVRQRLVGRTESVDFNTWTPATEILRAESGHPENQTYAMPIFEYRDLFLGLLIIFHTPSDTVHCELAWSADSNTWNRVEPGTPLIPKGPAGSPDSGCVYAAATPVVLDNEIRLYYGASNGPHTGWRDGSLCLARMRPDGFACLESNGSESAEIVTRPVRINGDLRLNVDASRGQVRVGILDAQGFSVDTAVPITADSIDHVCRWRKADLRKLRGREVRLVIELRSSRVYSFST